MRAVRKLQFILARNYVSIHIVLAFFLIIFLMFVSTKVDIEKKESKVFRIDYNSESNDYRLSLENEDYIYVEKIKSIKEGDLMDYELKHRYLEFNFKNLILIILLIGAGRIMFGSKFLIGIVRLDGKIHFITANTYDIVLIRGFSDRINSRNYSIRGRNVTLFESFCENFNELIKNNNHD